MVVGKVWATTQQLIYTSSDPTTNNTETMTYTKMMAQAHTQRDAHTHTQG